MSEHIVYKSVKDFSDEQVRIIALRYANTPYNHIARNIAIEFSRDEYTILPRIILKLIQKAIKKALVSEETAIKIRNKAVYNASLHGKPSEIVTRELYDSLIAERKVFVESAGKTEKKRNSSKTNDIAPSCSNEEKVKERLKYIENSLLTLNHHIEIFDEVNEEEITLDDLLSQKEKLEKEKIEIKRYWGWH